MDKTELNEDNASDIYESLSELKGSALKVAQMLSMDKNLLPQALFRTNAFALGDISAEKDSDGILRRARAFKNYRLWDPWFKKMAAENYGFDLSQARVETGRILLSRPDGTYSTLYQLQLLEGRKSTQRVMPS